MENKSGFEKDRPAAYDAVIVAGGSLEDDFALEVIRQAEGALLVCADRGGAFFARIGRAPDLAVGDFDSLDELSLAWLEAQPGTEICRLNPEKDDTDTQHALDMIIRRGACRIALLGCTGTRLDHVLASVNLLLLAKEQGARAVLLDPWNRISLPDSPCVLDREAIFGPNLSLFPWGGPVENLTLEGFYYPLVNKTLTISDAGLTVSNVLAKAQGRITFSSGHLLLIESREGAEFHRP